MNKNLLKLVSLVALFALLLSACTAAKTDKITASGTFSAIETSIVPEVSGKVTVVSVNEGDTVQAGQTLFILDAEFSQAQYNQASAAVKAAEAAVKASRQQAESAAAQYQLALQGALMQDFPLRQSQWQTSMPENYRPAWYFNESEMIKAAETQISSAQVALATALTELENEQKKASSKDFLAAEERLALAQVTLTVTETTLLQAQSASNAKLEDAAVELRDAAQAEFDAALLDYQRMLTTSAADSIILVRSRVAVAQTALDNARDMLLTLQTGDQSLQVLAAQKAAEAASSMASQAESGLEQAKQAQNLAKLQLDPRHGEVPGRWGCPHPQSGSRRPGDCRRCGDARSSS